MLPYVNYSLLTGDLLPAAAHPESQAPSILTGGFAPCGRTSQKPGSEYPHRGFAPCGRTSPPAWRRALQKGTKKPLEQVLRPLCTLLR